VPWLADRKWCYIRMKARASERAAELRVKIGGVDSPNSAGVVIDAIRLREAALDRGIVAARGTRQLLCMKSPPRQFTMMKPGNSPRHSLRKRGETMIGSNQVVERAEQLSHWDFQMDPGWKEFAAMTKCRSRIRELCPKLPLILAGSLPLS